MYTNLQPETLKDSEYLEGRSVNGNIVTHLIEHKPLRARSVFTWLRIGYRGHNEHSLNKKFCEELRVKAMLRPTVSRPVSWNKALIWVLLPDLYYCQTLAGLLTWGIETTPPTIHRCRGNFFAGCLIATIKGYRDRPTYPPLIRHEPHRK